MLVAGRLVEARGRRLRHHALGRRLQRQENAHFRAFLIHGDDQVLDHGGRQALAALDGDDGLLGLLAVRLEIEIAVDAAIAALLAALVGLRVDHRQRPFLELVFVLFGKLARALDIARHADDIEGHFRKRLGQTTTNETDGEMRDVDADPPAIKLRRGVQRRAATTERIEHDIAGIGGRG